MASKKILFQLEVQGADAIKTANELTTAIKQTTAALKETEFGTDEYRKLESELGRLKLQQKDIADSARIAQRAVEASAEAGTETYRTLNAQLVNARALFKELTEEERKGDVGKALVADIKRLDTELKGIDASIGLFQRNVGNYAGGIQAAFSSVLPGFEQLNKATSLVNSGIQQVGTSASATGKLLVGAFISFQVVGAILDGVNAVQEFVNEIRNLRGELGRLSGQSGEALDQAAAEVESIRNTFNVGTEETIQAANALDKAFDDINLNDSLALIEQGFLANADAGGQLLDVLKEYPRQFEQMGFSAEQFIAIQAKAGQEGIFSDKGIDAVKEFGIRIREQTDATRQSLEQAFGRDFTKELFSGLNSGAISVADAITQVSGKLRDTELPAKQLQQVVSDVFGGPGEDAGDTFLKSLADLDQGLKAAINTGDEYTKRLQDQLDAERALAQSKVEVTNKLADLTGGTETLGKRIQTFGINLFGKFLDAIKPVRDAFGRLFETFGELLQRLGLLPKEGEKTVGFLDLVGKGLSAVGTGVSYVVEGFNRFLDAVNRSVEASPVLSRAYNAVGATLRFLLDLITNFPSYFAGAVEAAKQFATNTGNFFRTLVVDAQILFAELQKLNPFGDADERLDAQIASLNSKKAEINKTGRTLAEAFKAGFDSVPKPEVSVQTPDGAVKPGASSSSGTGTGAAGLSSEQLKKQQDLQKAALDSEERYAQQRIELLKSLTRRLAEINIEAIKNEAERQIAAEQQKFSDLKAELIRQEQQQVAQIKETRAKIVAAYGEGSTQVEDFERKSAGDLEGIREQSRLLTEQAEKNHLNRISEIRNEAASNEARKELERVQGILSARAAAFDQAAIQEETRVTAQINRILNNPNLSDSEKGEFVLRLTFKADTEALQQESLKVLDQIETIENRLGELATSDDFATASLAEYEGLTGQLDQLYNQRANLERQYTELVQQEAVRRRESRGQEFSEFLNGASQVVDLVNQLQSAAAQEEINRIQQKEQERTDSIDRIQQKLQTATGAEKALLEKQLKAEQDALKKLEAEREKVEKQERARQKAFAIIQAIINTAQAVTKTLATLGIPAGIPAAALAGALGAAQIAVIAAQPAATGALIGDVPQQGSGLVVMAQNIPALSNGDNVLATLKRGEVVLNRNQQAALGGAPTFRAIRVPGFAEGGAAGSVISAPDITGVSSSERLRLLEKNVELLTDGIAATNSRIDRIRVVVVAEDIQDDLNEGETLRANASLSAD